MIRFQRPELPPIAEIERYYARAQQARWFSNFGPCYELLVERLEARLPQGVRAVPVANCTLGLMLALRVLSERRGGREVLLPSFTFVATASAVLWSGLEPVLVDVEPESWMPDPDALRVALKERSGRVACILSCTTFGAPPLPELAAAWEQIARDAGVPLLIDSAAGFGSRWMDGRPLCGLGDAEVFSMHATKPFAVGEGGLLCTRDDDCAEAVTRLANFGLAEGSVSGEVGLNAKLAEWPAATALAALDGIEDVLEKRRSYAARIRAALEPAGLTFQASGGEPAWQCVPALAPTAASREAVLASARSANVEVRTYFDPPLHELPALAGAAWVGELSTTRDLAARALSLPMANDLSDSDIDAIVGCVSQGLRSGVAR